MYHGIVASRDLRHAANVDGDSTPSRTPALASGEEMFWMGIRAL